MADLRISELPVLNPASLEADDPVAVADLSASETRKLTAKGLIQSGVKLVDDGSIPGAKVADDSLTALQIAPDAITASELADGSVDTAALQNLSVTDVKVADGINGAKIKDDTITATEMSSGAFDRGLNKSTGRIGHANSITPETRNGITVDGQGHVTKTAPLLSTDLPIATTALLGAAYYPAASGLKVSATGEMSHADAIAPATVSGIRYNSTGHIVATTPLVGTDLPLATSTAIGGVAVPTGDALGLTGAGDLFHLDSGVVPGEYTKVDVDQNGHVTAGSLLDPVDIPELDASKITTGEFDGTALLADRSVTQQKLANYSTAYIQEAQPSSLRGVTFDGCLWYQESTAQLRIWNNNSWAPVGFGRLSADNLRFGGTIDAATGLITNITSEATKASLKVGDVLTVATDVLGGLYFVVDKPGALINVAAVTGTSFDAGDWVMAVSATAGWVRINTVGGGGSGGGTSVFDDLLDVTLTGLAPDQLVAYDGTTAQWVNVGEVDGGTY